MKIRFGKKCKEIKAFDVFYLISILLLFCMYFGHSYFRHGYYAMIAVTDIFAVIGLLRGKRIIHKKYLLWYFVFFLLCTFSMLWTRSIEYSFDGVKDVLLIFLAIFGIFTYASDRKKIKQLFHLFLIACLYMCMRLILFETAQAQVTNDYGQIVGLYFNELAIALSIGVVFCFYFIMQHWNKKQYTLIYVLLSILFYYIIFVTGSRKALIFPVVFIVLYALITVFRSFKNKQKVNGKRLIAIVLIAVSAFGLALATNPRLTERFSDLGQSFFGASTEDASINERSYYRSEAMEMFSESPIIGNGINSFTARMESINYWHVAYSHCNYTELLSGLGILGFIVYYFGYFYVVKMGIGKRKATSDIIDYRFAMVFFIVLFVFEYGMVDYYLFPVQVAIGMVAILILSLPPEANMEKRKSK